MDGTYQPSSDLTLMAVNFLPRVLTSHGQLGETGREDGFLVGRSRSSILRLQGRWRGDRSRVAGGWTASGRSEK
jgi:hypothetical protein